MQEVLYNEGILFKRKVIRYQVHIPVGRSLERYYVRQQWLVDRDILYHRVPNAISVKISTYEFYNKDDATLFELTWK